jgi:hypothetical protein
MFRLSRSKEADGDLCVLAFCAAMNDQSEPQVELKSYERKKIVFQGGAHARY